MDKINQKLLHKLAKERDLNLVELSTLILAHKRNLVLKVPKIGFSYKTLPQKMVFLHRDKIIFT